MFERTLASESGRPRHWRGTLIVASAAAHVVAGATLVVTSLWNIEKLRQDEHQLVYVAAMPLPLPPAGGDGAPPPLARPQTDAGDTRRRAVRDRQPVRAAEAPGASDAEADLGGPADGDADGTAAGDPSGSRDGIGLGIGIGDGACRMPPCGPAGAGSIPTVEVPDIPDEPPLVSPALLSGKRIAGNHRIAPPDEVKQQMVSAGETELTAVIEMCLDARGVPTRLELIRSSGHQAYDHRLVNEMREWRYEPYVARGQPVPICTPIVFEFHLR